MARRRRRKMGAFPRTLFVMGGVGLAGYVAYQSGLFHAGAAWLQSIGLPIGGGGGGSQTPNGGGDSPDITINGQGILDWLKGILGNGDTDGGGFDPSKLFGPCSDGQCFDEGDAAATAAAGGAAAGGSIFGSAARTSALQPTTGLLNIFRNALAVAWVGGVIGGDSAAKLTGTVNRAITGERNSGIGFVDGKYQFTFDHDTGKCYNMAGRRVDCPDPSDVVSSDYGDFWEVYG